MSSLLTKQPQGYPAGIYFNMSNEDYHKDPALSHSGMTKVLISWPDYWANSCHNPDKEEYRPTDAMKFGDRSGQYLLENDKFYQRFATYKRDGGKGTGIYLSSVEYDRIRKSIEVIRREKKADEYFRHGYGEVSIFWRDPETGVMLRARIDYLRTFGAIDFKRIKGVNDWEIGAAVRNQGLDIQAYLYLEALIAARRMLLDMDAALLAAFAKREGVDPIWLDAFMHEEDLLFRFMFQRSTPPFIWEIRELEPEVMREGADATRKAILLYKRGIEKYGTGSPPCGTGEVKSISPFHVPRRNYDTQI